MIMNVQDMVGTQDQPHGTLYIVRKYKHMPKRNQALTSILLAHPRCLSSYPATLPTVQVRDACGLSVVEA